MTRKKKTCHDVMITVRERSWAFAVQKGKYRRKEGMELKKEKEREKSYRVCPWISMKNKSRNKSK